MMSIAAYTVGTQQVGMRRTVAAVTVIACKDLPTIDYSSASTIIVIVKKVPAAKLADRFHSLHKDQRFGLLSLSHL